MISGVCAEPGDPGQRCRIASMGQSRVGGYTLGPPNGGQPSKAGQVGYTRTSREHPSARPGACAAHPGSRAGDRRRAAPRSRPADVGGAAPLDPPTPPRRRHSPWPRSTLPIALPVTIRDFVFETERVKSPTAQKAQSKLWYAEGAWWAGLYRAVVRADQDLPPGLGDPDLARHRDGRRRAGRRADPDYLAVGDQLYVASAGTRPTSSSAARFLRFTYDAKAKRYVRDPDFPVQITDIGTNAHRHRPRQREAPVGDLS